MCCRFRWRKCSPVPKEHSVAAADLKYVVRPKDAYSCAAKMRTLQWDRGMLRFSVFLCIKRTQIRRDHDGVKEHCRF